jgi:pyruvate,water dikinase
MSFICPLDTNDDALEVVGGKGRSLAQMSNAGFAVPGGFQLTTAAYRAFIAANDLQERIVALAKPRVVEGRASFESASSSIQALILGKEMSSDLVAELKAAYAGLAGDDPAVAVRSSANAEDLPGLSFAGQQETYLNVRGDDALVAAVGDCWASLWTAQAISYRHEMGIDQALVAMAVVVQIMVPAEVAGILFTANPATGDRTEIIINASFGLGEAVVGGQVTPDTFIVDRDSRTAKETMLGPKEQKIVYDGEQGTRLEDVAENEREQSSLSDKLLSELAALALRVEEHFEGLPQDIEWALVGGELHLLQSRPITNLPPQPLYVVWETPEGVASLSRRQIVENVPDATSPLFDELYITEGLRPRREGAQSMYVTVNGIGYQRNDSGDPKAMKAFRERLLAEKEGPEGKERAQHDFDLFRSELSDEDRTTLDAMTQALNSDDVASSVTMPESDNPTFTAFHKTFTNDAQHKDFRERALPELFETTDKWRQLDIKSATDKTLLEGMRELAGAEGYYWTSNGGHTFGVAKSTDDQLQCFLREALPEHHFTSGQFLSGFKSKIMQANDDLFEICKLIWANESLYETVVVTPAKRLMAELQRHPDSGPMLEAFDTYLLTYGHQGYSLDFVEPTQIEDSSALCVTLKAMVQNKNYDPSRHEQEATRKREKALADIAELLSGLAYWQFRYRMWFAYKYYPAREASCFVLGMAWPVLRPMAAELGQRLVDVGTFEQPDDVYYLYTSELMQAMDARANGKAATEFGQLAAERRELRERRKRLHPPGAIPPEAIEDPGIAFKMTQLKNDDSSDTMMGIPVSPGTITARASVINNASEFDQMQPGSILVCPMTSPAWTQLFAHASGLVTDIGGILGHGSIVAREYGIPAVVGTGNSTQRIKYGQTVEVDGDAGTVVLQAEQ